VNGILEFNKWLHNEETSNYVQYVHLTATKRKSTGAETYYYECSRTGKCPGVQLDLSKQFKFYSFIIYYFLLHVHIHI
jgi:hypothetical protein